MCNNQFAHLHCHSEYSLLDGLSRVNDLVERAVELNQPAVALTDHGAMYGVMDFYRAATSANVKPIIGVETYIAARKMTDRDAQLDKERFHLLLLAQNQTGYLNLLEMSSIAQLQGYYYKPRVDHDILAQFSQGVISSTGCLAAKVPQALMHGRDEEAHRLMGEYLDIFGHDNFFIELQEHSIPELTEVNQKLIAMAPKFGLENNFLITNDVHYTRAEDADPHQVLLCIQTSSTVQNPKMTFSDKGYYLKSYDEMVADFERMGYASHVIQNGMANSLRITDMCDVKLDSQGYHLPEFDVPAGYDAHTYLRHLCEKGLAWRYGAERAQNDVALRQRLEHELGIISRMGFETYFLIVWDLCEWAVRSDEWWAMHRDPFPYSDYSDWKKNDIWWNVRGSGAGSVVAYTLGITSLDPLANGLIFERFLNPGRVSMPDIDLDYPDDVRHWMVAYTKRRYGSEKVAQIITYGTMGARAAIRDVGRALDMPLPEVDSVARLIPAVPGKPVKIGNVLDPEHEFYSKELQERVHQNTAVRTLIETAQGLEGITRHASSHAAGVIVSDRPLHEYVPLNRPTSGDEGLGGVDRVTQWPMEIVESIGLLKVDFLGLSTLTVMRQAARLIEQRHGVSYTMDNIPYDLGHVGPDPDRNPEALFDMLGRGEVAGVFQVEGAGMRRLMIDMKPRRFDHIIAAISLYRPGPMENIPEYIRRMHSDIYEGKDIVEYHTPALEPILKDTYGIIVYQEQIIRIASDLAGYAPGDADMIRKAVAKKKKKLMEEHQLKFTEGAMANGQSRAVCDAIWGDIEFFARYGFNKAHAADYAKVTCQTAFLKAHYAVEYLTAMLSVERDNSDKVRFYFAEAKNLNIDVAPPDVNRSQLDFTIEDEQGYQRIRFGLGAIKNAGANALMQIVDEREANGTFASLQELCERVDLRRVGKRALEYMIKGRAFDLWGSPPQLLEALDRIVAESGRLHDAAAAGQMSLFGGLTAAPKFKVKLLKPENELPDPVPHKQILEWEKEALGVHVSEHPLERPLKLMSHYKPTPTSEIDATQNGKIKKVAGMLSQFRTITTKKGDPMAFGTLEDLEGKIDLVFFPRTWQEYRDQVVVDQIMLVTGKVNVKDGDISLLVDKLLTTIDQRTPVAQQTSMLVPARESLVQEEEREEDTAVEPITPAPPIKPQPQRVPAPQPVPTPQPKPAVALTQNTAPASSATPPPPPAFEDDWQSDAPPPDYDEGDVTYVADPTAVAKPTKPQPPNNTLREKPAPIAPPRPNGNKNGNGNGYTRRPPCTITVELSTEGNWRQACEQLLNTAAKFNGRDRFYVKLPDHKLQIHFPQHNTNFCDALTAELEHVNGVLRVYAG